MHHLPRLLIRAGIVCIPAVILGLLAMTPVSGQPGDGLETDIPQNHVHAIARGVVALGVYDPDHAFAGDGQVAIDHVFVHWLHFDRAKFDAAARAAAARDRTLLVSIEPWGNRRWSGSGADVLTDIAAGRYDGEASAICEAVGALHRPVYLRFAAEMENLGDRYPWSGRPPSAYVAGYRHFVALCRAKAPEALFVWSPRGDRNLAAYYPGSDVVDEVGLSVFGLEAWDQDHQSGPHGFASALAEKYELVQKYGKPVMVAELGVDGSDDYRYRWLAGLQSAGQSFPLLRAVVYFDRKETGQWADSYGQPSWTITRGELLPAMAPARRGNGK